MTVYTLIYYSENGYDSCRGCVMERWDSEFEMISTSYLHEAVQFLIPYEREGKEVMILIDGRWPNQSRGYTDDYPNEQFDSDEEKCDELFRIAREQIEQIKAIELAETARKAEEARIAKEEATAAAVERKRLADIDLLRKLKEQYPGV